jgi:hypothetical protein
MKQWADHCAGKAPTAKDVPLNRLLPKHVTAKGPDAADFCARTPRLNPGSASEQAVIIVYSQEFGDREAVHCKRTRRVTPRSGRNGSNSSAR